MTIHPMFFRVELIGLKGLITPIFSHLVQGNLEKWLILYSYSLMTKIR